ncbi:MAG: hypothetical protein WCH99_15020 [Verrucomicrobiota bacterium]
MLKSFAKKTERGQPLPAGTATRWALALAFFLTVPAAQADDRQLAEEIRRLREQNTILQQQIKQQGNRLDTTLAQKVHDLESSREDTPPTKPESRKGFNLGKVNVSAEGGVGYAATGKDGSAPNGKFRVDEARVFMEAPLWEDIYFNGEVVLSTADAAYNDVKPGELYVEFENISKWWRQENQLNARLGQMYIPFGEEYISRNAIDNPLITHSLVDFWGVAPGVELYGNLGKFSYAAAAQNGADDANGAGGDKSAAGRISYDPNEHWHFSVSGMRTGDLKADQFSAMWFGNGFFHSIGTPSTTRFHAEAAEADITARWKSGHVGVFGGWAQYHDNDPSGSNARNIYYYSAEIVQNLPHKFFAATRWSQAFCQNGIPIAGFGEASDYSASLTTQLWRLSLGLGYRFSDRLVLKAEYAFERGNEAGGDKRQNEDFFGAQAAFKF